MPDVIEVVLQFLHCVLVAFAVRIIDLRPASDARFDQMPEMIKRDGLLIAFGALAPLRPRPNQANVAPEGIPKLRQLIEAKLPQPSAHRSHAMIVFACVNVIVWFFGPSVHCTELKKSKSSAVAAYSFLAEQNRAAVLYPYGQGNNQEERSTKDYCCGGQNNVEQPLQVMIRRNPGQLETCLERPERIDNSQRQITPVCLVERLQRVHARLLKLRAHKALQQFDPERTRPFGENDAAVTRIV